MSIKEKLFSISRLPKSYPYYNEIMKRHEEAIRNRSDIYIDPETGITVLTAEFLLKRGYCCESGCRHCPFYTR